MKKRLLASALLLAVPAFVSASTPPSFTWVASLSTVAYSLGWLMMVLMGVKWIIADSPNDRAEAKKGMIYIVIGLLLVASAKQLLQLYCDTAEKSIPGIDCNPADVGL